MSVSFIFTIITILLVISLIFSGISYNRQQTMKRKKSQINRYKQQADELINIISLLLKIDKDFALICQLQNIVVNTLQAAQTLAPADSYIASNYQSQNSRLQLFKSGHRENDVKCYSTNDTELNQAMNLILQLNKHLDIYRNRGILSIEKFQEFTLHLQAIKIDLDINSHLFQADSFAEENNITMYQMHLKQALAALKRSPIENNEKHARIKYLSNKLIEVKKTNKVLEDDLLFKEAKETEISSEEQ